MQIFTSLNENKNLSIALGYFDGVHLGHRAVINSAVNFAKKNNLKSAVITFKDHPCCFFYGVCPKYILTREQRREKLASSGIDYLYELDFDEKLSSLSAQEYLENILVKYFTPKSISTGFNHHFGAQKSGTPEFLRNNSKKYGYEYFEIPPQKIDNEIISSTAIRNCLQNGQIEKANKMLKDNFAITGIVVEGQKLGRKLGFKTANLIYPPELIELPFGVYETNTQYGKGITNFGIRPTVSSTQKPVAETHILNFAKDIYGEKINVEFVRMLRKEQKFNSVDELKQQIAKDISMINK